MRTKRARTGGKSTSVVGSVAEPSAIGELQLVPSVDTWIRKARGPSTIGGGGGGNRGFPRSAAGVAALYYAGMFEGKNIEKGLKYLQQFTPGLGRGTTRVPAQKQRAMPATSVAGRKNRQKAPTPFFAGAAAGATAASRAISREILELKKSA